jgi:hypothetical protein
MKIPTYPIFLANVTLQQNFFFLGLMYKIRNKPYIWAFFPLRYHFVYRILFPRSAFIYYNIEGWMFVCSHSVAVYFVYLAMFQISTTDIAKPVAGRFQMVSNPNKTRTSDFEL